MCIGNIAQNLIDGSTCLISSSADLGQVLDVLGSLVVMSLLRRPGGAHCATPDLELVACL